MKNVFKSTLIAIMCVAAYGCNAKVDRNFDHDACTIYTDAMVKAENKIYNDYERFYNNLRGYEIDIASNKYKQYQIDKLSEAHKNKQLTDREHAVMSRSVELIYVDTFDAYKQLNMLYEMRLEVKGYNYANSKRSEEQNALVKVAYDACRNWQ